MAVASDDSLAASVANFSASLASLRARISSNCCSNNFSCAISSSSTRCSGAAAGIRIYFRRSLAFSGRATYSLLMRCDACDCDGPPTDVLPLARKPSELPMPRSSDRKPLIEFTLPDAVFVGDNGGDVGLAVAAAAAAAAAAVASLSSMRNFEYSFSSGRPTLMKLL